MKGDKSLSQRTKMAKNEVGNTHTLLYLGDTRNILSSVRRTIVEELLEVRIEFSLSKVLGVRRVVGNERSRVVYEIREETRGEVTLELLSD